VVFLFIRFWNCSNKYHTVGTVPKSKRKIIETKTKIDTSNTHIQDRSLSSIPLTHIYKTAHFPRYL
jgi:hypothetical protein